MCFIFMFIKCVILLWLLLILNLKVKGLRCPADRLLPPLPGPHPVFLPPGHARVLFQSLPVAERVCVCHEPHGDLHGAGHEADAPLYGVCGEVHGRGATPRLSTVKTTHTLNVLTQGEEETFLLLSCRLGLDSEFLSGSNLSVDLTIGLPYSPDPFPLTSLHLSLPPSLHTSTPPCLPLSWPSSLLTSIPP